MFANIMWLAVLIASAARTDLFSSIFAAVLVVPVIRKLIIMNDLINQERQNWLRHCTDISLVLHVSIGITILQITLQAVALLFPESVPVISVIGYRRIQSWLTALEALWPELIVVVSAVARVAYRQEHRGSDERRDIGPMVLKYLNRMGLVDIVVLTLLIIVPLTNVSFVGIVYIALCMAGVLRLSRSGPLPTARGSPLARGFVCAVIAHLLLLRFLSLLPPVPVITLLFGKMPSSVITSLLQAVLVYLSTNAGVVDISETSDDADTMYIPIPSEAPPLKNIPAEPAIASAKRHVGSLGWALILIMGVSLRSVPGTFLMCIGSVSLVIQSHRAALGVIAVAFLQVGAEYICLSAVEDHTSVAVHGLSGTSLPALVLHIVVIGFFSSTTYVSRNAPLRDPQRYAPNPVVVKAARYVQAALAPISSLSIIILGVQHATLFHAVFVAIGVFAIASPCRTACFWRSCVVIPITIALFAYTVNDIVVMFDVTLSDWIWITTVYATSIMRLHVLHYNDNDNTTLLLGRSGAALFGELGGIACDATAIIIAATHDASLVLAVQLLFAVLHVVLRVSLTRRRLYLIWVIAAPLSICAFLLQFAFQLRVISTTTSSLWRRFPSLFKFIGIVPINESNLPAALLPMIGMGALQLHYLRLVTSTTRLENNEDLVLVRQKLSGFVSRWVAPMFRNVSTTLLFMVSLLDPTLTSAMLSLFALKVLLVGSGGERILVSVCMLDILLVYGFHLVLVVMNVNATLYLVLSWVGLSSLAVPLIAFSIVTIQIVCDRVYNDMQWRQAFSIDTILALVTRGNMLEVTLVILVTCAILQRRTLLGCINVAIVAIIMRVGRIGAPRVFPVLTWFWAILLWARWVLASAQTFLPPDTISPLLPWSSLPVEVQQWIGVGPITTKDWTVQLIVLVIGTIQNRAFRRDEHIERIAEQNPNPSVQSSRFIMWKVGALKMVSLIGLAIVTFLAVSAERLQVSALAYCLVSLYLLDRSTIPRPARTVVWTALAGANLAVVFLKVAAACPMLDPYRPVLDIVLSAPSTCDFVVFVLVVAQRRAIELDLFRHVRTFDRFQIHMHQTRARVAAHRQWRQRKLALIRLLRGFIMRQRRYIERWGPRREEQHDVKEVSILNKLVRAGLLDEHEHTGLESVDQLLKRMDGWEVALSASEPAPARELQAKDDDDEHEAQEGSVHDDDHDDDEKEDSAEDRRRWTAPTLEVPLLGRGARQRYHSVAQDAFQPLDFGEPFWAVDNAHRVDDNEEPSGDFRDEIIRSVPRVGDLPPDPILVRWARWLRRDAHDEFDVHELHRDRPGGRTTKGRLFELISALLHWFIARVAIWVHLTFLLSHVVEQSLISLVFPLSLFLYGVSARRPVEERRFTYCMLAFTETLVVVKLALRFTPANMRVFASWICALLYPRLDDIPTSWTDLALNLTGVLLLLIQRYRLLLRKLPDDRVSAEQAPEDAETSLVAFFGRLRIQFAETGTDLYTPIFTLDFLCFIYIAYLYGRLSGNPNSNIVHSLISNQVPLTYFLSILSQFCVMILDRIVYMRSDLTAKAILQGVHCIVWHSIMLTGYNSADSRSTKGFLIALHVLKSAYFYASACQIRDGYPPFAKGHFFTQQVSLPAYWFYVVYRSTPFLFEIRTILDWTCTPSPLSMFDWMKLEDIYSTLYIAECDYARRRHMRRRRGDIYPARIKAAIGAAVVVIMCLIIWGPLMLFVSGLSTENTSIVSDVSVSLSVHGSRLFFQNDVDSTRNLTGDDIGRLSKAPYNLDMSRAGHFLFGQQLNVAGNSSLVWNASPWVRQQLAEKGRLPIDVSFGFTRAGDNVDTVFAAHERVLDDVEISFLLAILNGTSTSMRLPRLYPLFFAMRPDGTVSIVDDAYADCQLALLRDSATGSDWWTLTTVGVNGGLPQVESRPGILLYALADVVLWQSISGGLSTTTIITLYLTIVLAIGRSIRSMLPRVDRIVYEEVPDVAAVKELCCDVFQARFDGDHVLEEDLFAELIQLYRSPEQLRHVTRPRLPMTNVTTWPSAGQLKPKES